MNIVPITEPDTLPIIYDRGLIGMYHDWCEPHSTYPRTYDLLHANRIISSTKNRYLSVSSLPSILHSVCYFSYGFIICYWWSLVKHSFHSACSFHFFSFMCYWWNYVASLLQMQCNKSDHGDGPYLATQWVGHFPWPSGSSEQGTGNFEITALGRFPHIQKG
jgi:hypothetical protein